MKRMNRILAQLASAASESAPLAIVFGVALAASQPGFAQTIPMSTFTHKASKDGKTYTNTIVGTSPFSKILTGTTINAVVIPVVVTINGTTFDPTLPDACDNVPALTRFQYSPLVNNVPNLTINGWNVGTTQFVNGFRRAEFIALLGPHNSTYQNPIQFTYDTSIGFSINGGWVAPAKNKAGCTSTVGILPVGFLQPILEKHRNNQPHIGRQD